LKPDNILVKTTPSGPLVKISDFGNSKEISPEGAGGEYFKEGVATFRTMPPEMIQGKKFGKWADTWALGILLYMLCALKHPFGKARIDAKDILVKDPDYTEISEKYSEETVNMIKLLL